MRNLKKFLALVLAMMMTFSLMVTVNAATASEFTDAESITDDFAEAIAVLEGLEVFEGYPDGTFKPKASISRAEVATIVYRLATGDVDGNQAHLYKDYGTFTDVTSDHWAAGYINYCANAEWIAGYGNGKFGPSDAVTGYQAAAMILRAVGYGKNKEFTGSGWQVQAANFSRTLGLLKNVNNTTYASTLNQPATRELVAEILFQAGLIDTVTWSPVFGYTSGDNSIQGQGNTRGLAWQSFELNVGDYQVIDKWGRPGYYWYKGTNTTANRVATIKLDPTLDLEGKAWKECDVAHELDIKTNATFKLYVNNNGFITDKYTIEATDTVTRVGGQGRITEFYGNATHPYKTLYGGSRADWTKSVTMIDTYLAKVTRVTERVLDPAGHVITPAYLYLDVYDGHGVGPATSSGVFFASGSAAKVNTTAHVLSDDSANWAYAEDDMILVRGYTDKYQWEVEGNKSNGKVPPASLAADAGYTFAGGTVVNIGDPTVGTTGLNHTVTQAAIEKAAFEPNCLLPAGGGDTNLEVVDKAIAYKAEMKTGKQTVTYWSEDKHTVDGTDYNDAMTLYLDVAGTTTGTTFAWYFDTFGNIIGIDNIPNTVNFGVITSIYSSFGQGEAGTDGTAKAIANVLYANGSTGTITIDRFLVSGTIFGIGGGHGAVNTQMTSSANSLDLLPVYDNSTGNVMTTSKRTTSAANTGWLHVAPVIAVNAVENGSNTNNYHGILRGNLFKFVASSDGNMTAIEVAGASNNTGVYAGHQNNTATNGKLFKSFSYIDLDNDNVVDVRLDSDAIIMVRASSTSTAVACYNMDTLPGDVNILANSEVDWADTDNDGRAEYVYLTGTSQGSLTYGLFYYNGGAAQWNGVDKTGTLTGWLNGDPATLTFIGETTFTAVRDSQSYAGHMFAVELTNGVVTALFDKGTTVKEPWLLWNYSGNVADPAAKVNFNTTFGKNTATGVFGLGSVNGNPYSTTTGLVYVQDTDANVTYRTDLNTVIAAGTTYYLNPNSKVVGLGMGVTEDGAILDYLNKSATNDVTIVYDNISKAIVEIYVATDPNVTPGTGTTTYAAVTASNGTTAQTAGINLTRSEIAPASSTYITRNGADMTTLTSVTATATVELLTSGGYVTVGTYTWTVKVTLGALDTSSTQTVSLLGGTYRINASVSNSAIGTLPIAVNQIISF